MNLKEIANSLVPRTLIGLCLLTSATTYAATNAARDQARANKIAVDATQFAQKVLDSSRNDSIHPNLRKHAQCVATLTNVKTAAFVFGARTGDGVVSCRTGSGWSDPIFIRVSGGSWGFQAGVQKADLIMVFTGDAAQKLVNGTRLQLGGDITVTAGPTGRSGNWSFDATHGNGVYTYARTKGAFGGIALDGTVLNPEPKYNHMFYGDSSLLNIVQSRGHAAAPLADYPMMLQSTF